MTANMIEIRRLLPRLAGAILAVALVISGSASFAAEWKPEGNISIVVGSAPGGPLDVTARLLQKIGIGGPVTILNKTGGAQAIAMESLNQYAGNGHYLAMVLPNILTNRITGAHALSYTDVTPLARLSQEYIGVLVRTDSPIKTAQQLIDRFRAAPDALSLTITGRVGAQHLAGGMIMSAAGVDVKKLKFVSFKGGSEAVPAVLGGHVDVLISSPTSTLKHVQSGSLRMLAVTAPQRLGGDLAAVPTWKEVGINAVIANWRGVVGPRGLSAAQIAYWDQTFAHALKSADWQEAAARFQWDTAYLNSDQTLKFMQQEYQTLTVLIRDLGDAK